MSACLNRYLRVVKAIQDKQPVAEVTKHLTVSTLEETLFAQQLITIAR